MAKVLDKPKSGNWAAANMTKAEAGPPIAYDDEGDWCKDAISNLIGAAAIEKATELLEYVTADPSGGQAKLSAADLTDFLEPFIGLRIPPINFLEAAREVAAKKGGRFPHTSIQMTKRSII